MLAAGIAACSEPASVRSDVLIARWVRGRLELTNTSTSPVHYFAAERETLTRVDWRPCTDPGACKTVPPSSTRLVPREEIVSDQPRMEEVVVFHWGLVVGNNETGFVADSIRSITVRVR